LFDVVHKHNNEFEQPVKRNSKKKALSHPSKFEGHQAFFESIKMKVGKYLNGLKVP